MSEQNDQPGTSPKAKKSKLEKIHELQAKCDRYKKEWSDASRDKRKYRKDLDESKLQVMSLKKKVETHVSETTILQKNLAEALQKLDAAQEEQRTERTELSNTAKELAQARLDHAKAVNDSRDLQAKIDLLDGEMKEKNRQIAKLEDELTSAKSGIRNLEADLLYADEQMTGLEDDIKKIEEELVMYREAAQKGSGEENGEKLREAREEIEKRLFDEREKRLEEKQRKLDEKMKQFENEREQYLEQQAKKDQELQEQQLEEGAKLKARDEDRQKLGDEINDRLKKLGDDNAALQGRLKSEQLDASMKLKAKDEAIEKLMKELAQVKEGSGASKIETLQEEIEAIKASVGTTEAELEDANTQNKILQDEVDELKNVNSNMKDWIIHFEEVTYVQKMEIEKQKEKLNELHAKSGEWSNQCHSWKERAEMWEKKAKELDPDAEPDEPSTDFTEGDPQALFLAAAVEKKKATAPEKSAGNWGRLGGMFKKTSTDVEEDAQARIEELEIENTKQAVEINTLKKEIYELQTTHKEELYSKEQEVALLRRANEAIGVRSANLQKELDLARKLNQSMTEDIDKDEP
jgi:chromosome segregation ATPase